MILDYVLYLIGFILLVIIQSLVINGIKGAMGIGMILEGYKNLLAKNIKNRHLQEPLFDCIKCMASIYTIPMYWPLVIWLFGFNISEVFIYVANVFAVSYMNFYFYKKV